MSSERLHDIVYLSKNTDQYEEMKSILSETHGSVLAAKFMEEKREDDIAVNQPLFESEMALHARPEGVEGEEGGEGEYTVRDADALEASASAGSDEDLSNGAIDMDFNGETEVSLNDLSP